MAVSEKVALKLLIWAESKIGLGSWSDSYWASCIKTL